MARKKVLPKKIGPVKIPKSLRRMGDKALADPHVAGVVSGALVSIGALVAARKVVEEVPGGAALTRSVAHSKMLNGVADVVKKALEEATGARHQPREEVRTSGKSKRRKAEPDAHGPASEPADEDSVDQVH